MKSLMEELKNNFKIRELREARGGCPIRKITTEWFDTHDKAVDSLIKILKDKGMITIVLPYLPVPYIINDRQGNHQGVLPYLEYLDAIDPEEVKISNENDSHNFIVECEDFKCIITHEAIVDNCHIEVLKEELGIQCVPKEKRQKILREFVRKVKPSFKDNPFLPTVEELTRNK